MTILKDMKVVGTISGKEEYKQQVCRRVFLITAHHTDV
jgi:hypothetical protein